MDLAYELHDLVRTLDRAAERLLRPEGLSYNRYVALIILSEHPGMTGRELAGALGVTEAAGSSIVRALLDAGLIENLAAPGSGNVRRLQVVDRGMGVLERCSELLTGSLDENARRIGVDPDQLAHLIHALHIEVQRVERTEDK